MNEFEGRLVEMLLVEDTPTDVRLTMEAFKRAKFANHLSVVENGLEAMKFLRREDKYATAPRPDLILLDLKLPAMDGHEVLAAIKADGDLKSIPVVVLTSSLSDMDVARSYNLHASCYITKPIDFEEFVKVVSRIESFWFSVVVLPSRLPGALSSQA
jgi:two-component system response regulator